ncbi:hypothetical protein BSKO_01868 [Bryopsis sp. KO-2023]|nr:hypothetical protein BSKO_01868 [Bryopsis sp. KO-2023]
MSGFSPNPDPIHVTGLSSKAGHEERLQSEVLRLHHILEANNIEMAQLRSALGEYEELAKELADVLLSYHRQCTTASRGKMCERLTAELADVLLNYHRQCLSASRGKIPRFRITVEPFYGGQETHGFSRAPTQAGQESNQPSPFRCNTNPSQYSRSSGNVNLKEEGKARLSQSSGFRFNRGFVEPCRESGWDIRWGQAANDSGGDEEKTQTSKDDAHPKHDIDQGEGGFARPRLSDDFSGNFDGENDGGNTPAGRRSESNTPHGNRNEATTPNDPLDEDSFLAMLTELNVKSSQSKDNEKENGFSKNEGLFRFNAMNAESFGCETDTRDLHSTPQTKKRPKPADTLGLADRFSTKSPLKGPFSATSSMLGGGTPGDRAMDEPPKHPYEKTKRSFIRDDEPDDTANLLEGKSRAFKSWMENRSPVATRTGKDEGRTPEPDVQGIATKIHNLSEYLNTRKSGLEGMQSPKPATRYPEENPFSSQDAISGRVGRYPRTPLPSEMLPPSNPPSEAATPQNRRLPREFGVSFTARLERFDKLIHGKLSSDDREPAFGSNFSGSPRSTNKTRKSIPSKIDELMGSETSSQDENKAPRGEHGLSKIRTTCDDDRWAGKLRSVCSETQVGIGGKGDNAPNGRSFGGGLKFKGVQRSSALGASQPFGENTSLNINKHAGETRQMLTTPLGERGGGGRHAYDNALMVIKNGAYQLRKVTPVSKRATRTRRAPSKPSCSSTFRRYLHARRQAVGLSEDESD